MMSKIKITTSLIISTYNWPAALNLCLLSIKNQSILPSEVIIADDGSTDETKELIDLHRKNFPVPLIHVWQPDEGFQLSKIRNKAIAASTKEYIIQIDGDLILHPHFVRDHIHFSKTGAFATGSRVIINEKLSEKLLKEQSIAVNILVPGIKNRANGFRFNLLTRYLAGRYRNNDIYYMRGCNMAFWRDDLIRINGYNEEFTGWGREDNEIAARLLNAGVKKRVIKFGGVVFHIFHHQKSRASLSNNDDLMLKTIMEKLDHCEKGLNQYL